MSVFLLYTKEDGTQEQTELTRETTSIDLTGRHIEHIDLNPVSSCYDLEELRLYRNRLKNIDLVPLSRCTRLQEFDLSYNKLQSVDLQPLDSCTQLRQLSLENNLLDSIDLSGLGRCARLQRLLLYANRIRSIDLSALSSCVDLKELSLHMNQLRNVDLAPLKSCIMLQRLSLHANQLRNINLSPLGSCSGLREILLHENQLQSIDLAPLKSCTALREIWLSDNRLESIDLSLLTSCMGLQRIGLGSCVRRETLLSRNTMKSSKATGLLDAIEHWRGAADESYDVPVRVPSLQAVSLTCSLLSEREPPWKMAHLFQSALSLVGLAWAGYVEDEDCSLLRKILERIDSPSLERWTCDQVIDLLCKQIDTGGTTIGLDVGRMAEYGSLTTRIAKVIRLRNEEMHRLVIPLSENGVDLKQLWLTAYGHKVLTVLGLGTVCDIRQFETARNALAELGYELNTTEDVSRHYPVMSERLEEYIWTLADYRSRIMPH